MKRQSEKNMTPKLTNRSLPPVGAPALFGAARQKVQHG